MLASQVLCELLLKSSVLSLAASLKWRQKGPFILDEDSNYFSQSDSSLYFLHSLVLFSIAFVVCVQEATIPASSFSLYQTAEVVRELYGRVWCEGGGRREEKIGVRSRSDLYIMLGTSFISGLGLIKECWRKLMKNTWTGSKRGVTKITMLVLPAVIQMRIALEALMRSHVAVDSVYMHNFYSGTDCIASDSSIF